MRGLSRDRRIRPILAGALIGTVAGLVVSWLLVYRPWEEHYRLRPATWWAGRFLEWKTTCRWAGGVLSSRLEDAAVDEGDR